MILKCVVWDGYKLSPRIPRRRTFFWRELTMNAFTQNEFKNAYKAVTSHQLRSLADHGHAEARELLALGPSDNKVSVVSTPIQFSRFARLARWFWSYTERLCESWSKHEPHNGL